MNNQISFNGNNLSVKNNYKNDSYYNINNESNHINLKKDQNEWKSIDNLNDSNKNIKKLNFIEKNNFNSVESENDEYEINFNNRNNKSSNLIIKFENSNFFNSNNKNHNSINNYYQYKLFDFNGENLKLNNLSCEKYLEENKNCEKEFNKKENTIFPSENNYKGTFLKINNEFYI